MTAPPPGPPAPARAAPPRLRRFVPVWIALVLATIVVDLAMVAAYVHLAPGEAGHTLAPSFPVSYKNWVMWAVFSLAIVVAVHRMVAHRWSWGRRLLATLALAVALPAAHALVEVELHRMAGAPGATHDGSFVSYHLFHGLVTFCALFTVALLVEAERATRARELREAQLQEAVSRAQLDTLRMQLQPHFLFNTLNSASALVEDDVRGGQRMLSRLSDFLRATLASAEHREVPLRDELELLRTYVEIERVRFGDRLRVVFDVADGVLDVPVPNLLLQPIVENAIRHGIQPSVEGGTVTIRAAREGDRLAIEVADDGVGLRATGREGAEGGGIGLANTAARLRQCYGDAGSLAVAPRLPAGTTVTLHLPVAAAAAAARA